MSEIFLGRARISWDGQGMGEISRVPDKMRGPFEFRTTLDISSDHWDQMLYLVKPAWPFKTGDCPQFDAKVRK